MPGTVMVAQEVVVETLIHVMLGLWNHGCRKQIIINNHGQLWMLETALHEFFIPIDRADSLETTFIHATLVEGQILEAYPSGKLPPIDQITLRDPKELEPFLKVPSTPGWKSVFELPLIGPFTKG
jgi:hypothetical protein